MAGVVRVLLAITLEALVAFDVSKAVLVAVIYAVVVVPDVRRFRTPSLSRLSMSFISEIG